MGPLTYSCGTCMDTWSTREGFHAHKPFCREQVSHSRQCPKCPFSFPDEQSFKSHWDLSHKPPVTASTNASTNAPVKASAKAPVKASPNPPVKAPERAPDKGPDQAPDRAPGKPPGKGPGKDSEAVMCVNCRRWFPTPHELSLHKEFPPHYCNFECNDCGLVFNSEFALHNHQKFPSDCLSPKSKSKKRAELANSRADPANDSAEPANDSGRTEPANGHTKPANGHAESANGLPESANGLPESANGLPESANGLPQSTNGRAESTDGPFSAYFSNVSTHCHECGRDFGTEWHYDNHALGCRAFAPQNMGLNPTASNIGKRNNSVPLFEPSTPTPGKSRRKRSQKKVQGHQETNGTTPTPAKSQMKVQGHRDTAVTVNGTPTPTKSQKKVQGLRDTAISVNGNGASQPSEKPEMSKKESKGSLPNPYAKPHVSSGQNGNALGALPSEPSGAHPLKKETMAIKESQGKSVGPQNSEAEKTSKDMLKAQERVERMVDRFKPRVDALRLANAEQASKVPLVKEEQLSKEERLRKEAELQEKLLEDKKLRMELNPLRPTTPSKANLVPLASMGYYVARAGEDFRPHPLAPAVAPTNGGPDDMNQAEEVCDKMMPLKLPVDVIIEHQGKIVYNTVGYTRVSVVKQANLPGMIEAYIHLRESLQRDNFVPHPSHFAEENKSGISGFKTSMERSSPRPALKVVVISCVKVLMPDGSQEAVKLAAIDFASCRILVNNLVCMNPPMPVQDWKTRFTGIHGYQHLEHLRLEKYKIFKGWQRARDALWEFIDQDTIIVGHNLRADLDALRMTHGRAVDIAIMMEREVALRANKLRFHKDQLAVRTMCKGLGQVELPKDGSFGRDPLQDAFAIREIALKKIKDPDADIWIKWARDQDKSYRRMNPGV